MNLISQTIGVHEITEYLCPKLKLFPWYNNVAIGSEYMILLQLHLDELADISEQ